jgi:hypothetical protein
MSLFTLFPDEILSGHYSITGIFSERTAERCATNGILAIVNVFLTYARELNNYNVLTYNAASIGVWLSLIDIHCFFLLL